MPMFFFDTEIDGILRRDETGHECEGPKQALSSAREGARQLAAEKLRFKEPVEGHTIIVRDVDGAEIGRVALADAGQDGLH